MPQRRVPARSRGGRGAVAVGDRRDRGRHGRGRPSPGRVQARSSRPQPARVRSRSARSRPAWLQPVTLLVGAVGPALVVGRAGAHVRLGYGEIIPAAVSAGGSFAKRFATTDGIRRNTTASSGSHPGTSAREGCSASTTSGFSIAPHGRAPRSASRRLPSRAQRAEVDRSRRRGEFSGLRVGELAAPGIHRPAL
jgi:hypothetical protein